MLASEKQETFRVFADHYQFYFYDSDYDHFSESRLEWKEENKKQYGYLATERCVYVSTVAHLNDHTVRVFLNTEITKSYEQIFETQLETISGSFAICGSTASEEETFNFEVPAGVYSVKICSNSIGKDMFSYDKEYDEDMSDTEYFEHEEFEYYDIYLKLISKY